MALPIRGWIYMIVPVIGLGLGSDARADKKVDWTPYLEQPGERLKPRAAPKVVEAPAPKKAKAQPRAAKPRVQAQAKPKATTKRKAKSR